MPVDGARRQYSAPILPDDEQTSQQDQDWLNNRSGP